PLRTIFTSTLAAVGTCRFTVLPAASEKLWKELKAFPPLRVLVVIVVVRPLSVRTVAVLPSGTIEFPCCSPGAPAEKAEPVTTRNVDRAVPHMSGPWRAQFNRRLRIGIRPPPRR